MSLRQRVNVPSTLVDRENAMTKMLKQPVKGPSRRPALGELGNKIHSRPVVQETKKLPIVHEVKQVQKVTKKQTTTVTTEIKKVQTEIETINVKEKKILLPVPRVPFKEDVAYSTQLTRIFDEDVKDKADPFLVSEYVQDIYEHLRFMEAKYAIRPDFLKGHKSTSRMRTILINWMVEVHLNFNLLLETFHTSVAIVDRYLQISPNIGRSTLQLVGTTALLIACKYEEIRVPSLCDFVYICDDTFTSIQILTMEKEIVRKLEFNLGRPISLHFLRRFSKIAGVHPEHHAISKYLLELALLNYELCHKRPSLQAAAACCLSISIWNDIKDLSEVWTTKLEVFSSYKLKDIKQTVAEMANILMKIEKCEHKAVQKKYAASRFFKISTHHRLRGSIVQELANEAQQLKKTK